MDIISVGEEILGFIYLIFSFLDVISSTIAAIIVIYLFLFKRKAISSIYTLLLNYIFQTSQNELLGKIKEVTGINADDDPQKVSEILFDIKGQMQGNPILAIKCKSILNKLSKFEKHPERITNVNIIGLMAELKEKIKYINIQSYNEFMGEIKDE